MQETAKINYIQYGRGSKTKGNPNQDPVAAVVVMAVVAAESTLQTPENPPN